MSETKLIVKNILFLQRETIKGFFFLQRENYERIKKVENVRKFEENRHTYFYLAKALYLSEMSDFPNKPVLYLQPTWEILQ